MVKPELMGAPKSLVSFTFATSLGWMGVVGSEVGLRRVILPKKCEEEAIEEIFRFCGPLERDKTLFGELPILLERYMEGHQVRFHEALDVGWASPFCQRVWAATMAIPYGQIRSYSWVAQEIGNPRAMRAVGRALALNPVPVVVPCHRVLEKGGGLGGFTAGLDMKRLLLTLEGLDY